jgi:pimeloyl-ACP methyl ester carboxylesterase
VRSPARLRRAYFDCRYGQLHLNQAIPPGGGFDEATALLCVPGARGLGGFFRNLLGPLGADRSVYAPDLPGCGASDAAGTGAGPEQYALALADLLDELRLRSVDVLAQAEGANTALALARLRPGGAVRRMVFSASPPGAPAAARTLGVPCHEVSLAGAAEVAMTADSVDAQLHDLTTFLSSGSSPSVN